MKLRLFACKSDSVTDVAIDAISHYLLNSFFSDKESSRQQLSRREFSVLSTLVYTKSVLEI